MILVFEFWRMATEFLIGMAYRKHGASATNHGDGVISPYTGACVSNMAQKQVGAFGYFSCFECSTVWGLVRQIGHGG